ncbi:nonribosomal peptide synthase [Aspergillus terreus]|uniref:Nonribosomal peptide synthase n=1 Tax=Aspergillus terreus TaxID=33178 RepID=A0A5M3Z3Z3_ASPTE|nr:hypothetical protein ATETN484_0007003500 [Aspergillus terreus]GFF15840.1 nonribosomal peptide synthase [Aspergillus terreus]
MEQVLVQNARASPNDTAIIDSGLAISYQGIIRRADFLVEVLQEKRLKMSEPVGIVFESGYKQVISQVAVLRSGGTCVPVEPSMPSMRLTAMLNDINARYIITSSDLTDGLSNFTILDFDNITDTQHPIQAENEIFLRANCDATHCSHILFTSGSTGRPKPIQVSSGSILHVLDNFPTLPLGPSDRMSMFINPGFDFSLFEIWGALLSGATAIRIPKLVITDPTTVGRFLSENNITVMIFPTALFNTIALSAPESFRGCRHVIVGGEAANVTSMRMVLGSSPPRYLWNAYGPTETTIWVTMGLVDLAEAEASRISIGQPLGETKIYLLNEERDLITDIGKRGEICVSGPQVSRGYLHRPEETQDKFIDIPASDLGEQGASVRLYRTSDLGEWRRPGVLDYIGRADKQIKRSGHRVELGDIERTLEMHPSVHACVAIQHKQETSDILAAYLIFNSPTQMGESQDLTGWARERLPPYMVPDMIKQLQKFPLTNNGKVDREYLRPDMEITAQGQEKEDSTHQASLGDKLRSKLQEYLNAPGIGDQDNIISLGLTSLQAARLVGAIKKDHGRSITLAQLYEHPTIEGLVSFLGSSNETKIGPDEQLQRWQNDSRLADDIVLPPDWQSDTEGRVFVTGATGFVGSFMLHALLSMTTVKNVACLARGSGNLTPANRIQKAMEKYDLWDGSLEKVQKIIVLDGDLSKDTLGLGEEKFQWLANWASVIFHVGARVNWCEPYEAHFDANVTGTRNIIQVARSGRPKALHYLSSIDAWNVTGHVNNTERVLEDESLLPHRDSLLYDMGYAQSQWVADEMIQRAMRRGLPAAIYRPGFVIGDSQRAIGNPDDFFARFIVGCIQTGCYPHLPRQRLEYVTVDYVCAAMIHIAANNDNLGHGYHLVSPDPADSVSLEGTYDLLKEAGYLVEQIPYANWVEMVRQASGNPLEPMLPLLQEPVLDGLSRLQTSMNTPVYDAQNTLHALADRPDIKYVPLDHKLLRSFVEFWEKRGYFTLCRDGCEISK